MKKYDLINSTKTGLNLHPSINQYSFNENNNNINTPNINIYEQYNTSNLDYYEIKNIIRNEFAEMILPYQKKIYNNDSLLEQKLNNLESNIKSIIDSKTLENLNQSAKMINLLLKNQNNEGNSINQNNSENKNIFQSKLNLIKNIQYDNRVDILEKQVKSMNSLLNTLQKTFDSNMLDIFKKDKSKNKYAPLSDYEMFKNEIRTEIKRIKEEQGKYENLNEKIEKAYNNLSELSNEISNISINEINVLKNKFNNIDNILVELKNKLTNSQIDKLRELNIDGLKNINIYEINELKNNIKNINNNLDDLF